MQVIRCTRALVRDLTADLPRENHRSGAVLDDSIGNNTVAARRTVSAMALAPIRPEQLVHERVRRFMKLLPEVLNSEDEEAVHDLRVWSRRLQQVLVTMFPKGQENRAGSLIRALRQARRGLSGWRDCDVLIALLDRRLHRLRDPDEQRAWQAVRAYLIKRREREIRRARYKLAKRKLFTLGQRAEYLLVDRERDAASNSRAADTDFIPTASELIKAAYADWQAALARAAESGNQADAHYFRIKTKRLRYRMELARDLGNKELLLPLNWLKWLQDSLGQCHDRAELARIAIEAIANTEFLLDAPRPASLLLKRLARELLSEATKLKSLLAAAKDGGELSSLEGWVASHSGRADSPDINRPSDES
jgi:CHAD domain-containing protein